ncbi:class I SAM-dependent methyltransferase [Thermaerobacter litoralis]
MTGHPIFAAFYDLVLRPASPLIDPWRRRVVAGAAGQVLEVGVGTGLNLPFYRLAQVERLVGLEPDPHMGRRAAARARRLGIALELVAAPAEAMPFADASFDTVVATHVFCSVQDPDRALREVFRVLRPGGTFRFLEHVRAGEERAARRQDRWTPVWRLVAAGCHPNRRTVEAIAAAGFVLEELERFELPAGGPVRPQAFGVARRPGG